MQYLDRLDARAIARINGPAWTDLRAKILGAAESLLSVSPNARGTLTTIYVKFERSDGTVYAVMWIRTARQLVIGLSLPETIRSVRLGPPTQGMKYPNLTGYLSISAGDDLPTEFQDWANAAFANHDRRLD